MCLAMNKIAIFLSSSVLHIIKTQITLQVDIYSANDVVVSFKFIMHNVQNPWTALAIHLIE